MGTINCFDFRGAAASLPLLPHVRVYIWGMSGRAGSCPAMARAMARASAKSKAAGRSARSTLGLLHTGTRVVPFRADAMIRLRLFLLFSLLPLLLQRLCAAQVLSPAAPRATVLHAARLLDVKGGR